MLCFNSFTLIHKFQDSHDTHDMRFLGYFALLRFESEMSVGRVLSDIYVHQNKHNEFFLVYAQRDVCISFCARNFVDIILVQHLAKA